MYHIDQRRCTFCAGCSSVCPVMAITIRDHASKIGAGCTGCGTCVAFCPIGAISAVAPQASAIRPPVKVDAVLIPPERVSQIRR